jgi:hypothetical protein
VHGVGEGEDDVMVVWAQTTAPARLWMVMGQIRIEWSLHGPEPET